MQYDDYNGRVTAKRWKVPASTLSRWKRSGVIPDHRAMGKPLSKADLEIEQRLIRLVEAGWLKAKPISRLVGSQDKINALLTARRYPSDSRYHVNHLRVAEIKRVNKLLNGLAHELGMLLYLASIKPFDQNYSNEIQANLRAILGSDYINGANIRMNMDKQRVSRFWGFMRGSKSGCEDLDSIFDSLHPLLKLLFI